MTAQIPENIDIDGETFSMCTEHLADYFRLTGKHFNVEVNSSARGADTFFLTTEYDDKLSKDTTSQRTSRLELRGNRHK